MAKVISVITRSLRVLSVIDRDETPDAKQVQDGIEALNGMMRRWEANGLAVGWSDVRNGDDDLPAPDEAQDAIIFNLAIRLRPEYGVALEGDVYALATSTLADLRRDVRVANPLAYDRCGGYYNIRSDTYE